MSRLKLPYVPSASRATYTGENREITFDPDTTKLVIHDGATAGGLVVGPTPDYTSADFSTDFGNKTTDDLTEGTTNKYYDSTTAANDAPVQSVSGKTGTVSLSSFDVGLGNVPNEDATDPANWNQDGAASGDQIVWSGANGRWQTFTPESGGIEVGQIVWSKDIGSPAYNGKFLKLDNSQIMV